jgi:hypothetical protein
MKEPSDAFRAWKQAVNDAIGIPALPFCGGCDEAFLREKFAEGMPPQVFAYYVLATLRRRLPPVQK